MTKYWTMSPPYAAWNEAGCRFGGRENLAVLGSGMVLISAIQAAAYLNHDVAWFAWGANRMAHGAVLGRDLIEPNFPLAYLIYFPALLFSSIIGLSAAVKLWVVCLIGLSGILCARRLKKHDRIAFLTVFGLFCALAMPREYGQREHIAFLLVLPYCISSKDARAPAILVGVMAGIGFAIKPHFLIALAVVEIGRKPFRIEQLSLIAAGALYAAVILLFFRPFVFEMLPVTHAVYWAFDRSGQLGEIAVAASMAAITLMASQTARSRTAKTLAIAAAGFLLAAIAQQRLYSYQLLPMWGFISVSSAVLLANRRKLYRMIGFSLIGGVAVATGPASVKWWHDSEDRQSTIPQLIALLDQRASFTVFSVHPYPAFPTALHTWATYTGLSNSHWFLPAVAQSGGFNKDAVKQAIRLARADLASFPAIVVVDTNWRRHTESDPHWNGLDFLLRDTAIRKMWKKYQFVKSVGPYDFYVRHP